MEAGFFIGFHHVFLTIMKTIIFDLDGTLVRLAPTLACIAEKTQLAELRKEYNFALVTGSPRAELEDVLKTCELREFFDDGAIVTCEEVGSDKSSGVPFEKIRERITGACVMIGDSDSDEVGSGKTGIPFVKVGTMQTLDAQKLELVAAIQEARNTLKIISPQA